jgi:ketosteroid isomerase-like protein
MSTIQSEIRALLDGQNAAIGGKDIDQLMSFFSSDIVYYDVVPPLQFVGSAALRRRFREWLDGFDGPIEMEMHDVKILGVADFAVACRLSRSKGTLKSGQQVGRWVRATSCCQRSDRQWRVTHEHISWPADPRSGMAAMDLAP